MTSRMLVACCGIVLGMSAIAQAQIMVDMSKFTCDELLKGSGNSVEAAIWISGYYNGQKKNTTVDVTQFQKNAGLVVAECKSNPKATVMEAVDKLMSGKK